MRVFKTNFKEQINLIKERQNVNRDSRLYVPRYGDDGIARATIRFLPSFDVDIPYVTVHKHWFKCNGEIFDEFCPNTINKRCPICEDNNKLWETNEDLVRQRNTLRQTHHFSNVLILDDAKTPENNGKVFILRYPKQIINKILEAIKCGTFPFDLNSGINFYFNVKKNSKMYDYSGSHFSDTITGINSDDHDRILNDSFELAPFCDPKIVKSYDELKSKFDKLMNNTYVQPTQNNKYVQPNVQPNQYVQQPQPQPTNQYTQPPIVDSQHKESNVFDSQADEDFFSRMNIQ